MFQACCPRSRTMKVLLSVLAAAVLASAVAAVIVVLRDNVSHKGAIATDGSPCNKIGRQLMEKGGNGVDVSIGVLMCEGLASAQSMGLGGGFLMTIYDRKNKKPYVLNARESAPAAATKDMFGDNKNQASLIGGLAIAVPGELLGYHAAYTRFGGKLAWKDIVAPIIKVAEEGVVITQYVADVISRAEKLIRDSPTISELLLNENGELKKKGDLLKRPKLAKTLRVIADEGGLALHNGSLTNAFLKDLKDFGSIITEDDLRNYQPRWEEPTVVSLPGGFKLVAPPPPGSGPLVAYFLTLAADLVKPPLKEPEQYQRIVEAMKFTYAARFAFGDQVFEPDVKKETEKLIDPTFIEEVKKKITARDQQTSQDPSYYGANLSSAEPKGTAHVSIVTEDFAVSVTSTVNTEYGSKLVSPSTGIILNNEMDDFSLPGVNSTYGLPPSEANFIKPGKRPQSSMAGTVILDANDDVKLVIGGSGGVRITSAISLVALLNLYLDVPLDEAVATKRIHHQLLPMQLKLETGYPQEMVKIFHDKFGHETTELVSWGSSVMAIGVDGKKYHPVADERREGTTALLQ